MAYLKKLILVALSTQALESPRRRLRDTVDLGHVKEKAEAEAFTGALSFKLAAAAAAERGADKLADQVANLIECASAKRVFRPAGKHEAKHHAAGLDLWYAVKCATDDDGALEASRKAASKLEAYLELSDEDHEGVQIIEPELVHLPLWTPNDPQYGDQAGHYNAVNLAQAWDTVKGNPNVVVQVLDTGLDLDHPDLQLNIWRNEGETDCDDGIDNDNNGFVDDCHGYNHADDAAGPASSGNYLGSGSHGSHCGGTIAADNHNGVGVSGVAGGDGSPNTGAKLMVSVGFGKTATRGFAEALVYGADNGAQISSNSWGYTAPNAVEQSVLDAIDYYTDASADGGEGIEGIVVFAAGNDNSNANYYPGFYDKTVAVAATTNGGSRASFSNYGDWIDISAPGVSILSTVINGYSRYSGTSMACPHVAGILALCLSANPSLSRQDVLDMLYDTADPLTDIMGAGMANAEAFVAQCANGAPSPRPTISLAPTTSTPTLRPTVSPAPTQACICDQRLVLKLKTDSYPGETAWTFEMTDPGPGCVDSTTESDEYTQENKEYVETISTQICAGQAYSFEITDSWGDGICCDWGRGSYVLELDGKEVASGGSFGRAEKTSFVAPRPSPRPTVQPTAAPTAKPTPRPTPRPTIKPTAAPTAKPTARPTPRPTIKPTAAPTAKPTARPTPRPTIKPTAAPTAKPTPRPTPRPTIKPTAAPTAKPTARPTPRPTIKPTAAPTAKPTPRPTPRPTKAPTKDEIDWDCSGYSESCHRIDHNNGDAFRALGPTKSWGSEAVCANKDKQARWSTHWCPKQELTCTKAKSCRRLDGKSGKMSTTTRWNEAKCLEQGAKTRWTTTWCPDEDAPAPTKEFPTCGVRITRGRGQDPNNFQCVTDPSATEHLGKKIAFACCEADTCTRMDEDGQCYAGPRAVAPKDWYEATNACAAEGKVLCGVDKPCSRTGCSYDNHYQWTGEACQAGDTLHGATFDGCR